MGIIRKTRSVDSLLAEFQNSTIAISAIDLIKRFDNKLNKTTVYRILDKLEDDGILHSFLDKKGIRWYAKCDGCTYTKHVDAHPHFECLSCGKVDCLAISIRMPKIPNREVLASQILIQGKCELCFG